MDQSNDNVEASTDSNQIANASNEAPSESLPSLPKKSIVASLEPNVQQNSADESNSDQPVSHSHPVNPLMDEGYNIRRIESILGTNLDSEAATNGNTIGDSIAQSQGQGANDGLFNGQRTSEDQQRWNSRPNEDNILDNYGSGILRDEDSDIDNEDTAIMDASHVRMIP